MANEQGAFKGDEGCLARPFLQRVQGICDSHNLIKTVTYPLSIIARLFEDYFCQAKPIVTLMVVALSSGRS